MQAGYVSCARSRASGVVATMMDASLGRQSVASVPHVASCVVALFACHTLRLIVASCEGQREKERPRERKSLLQFSKALKDFESKYQLSPNDVTQHCAEYTLQVLLRQPKSRQLFLILCEHQLKLLPALFTLNIYKNYLQQPFKNTQYQTSIYSYLLGYILRCI